MINPVTLHVRDRAPGSDGRLRAITAHAHSRHSISVVAGALHDGARAKGARGIQPDDYVFRESVSFAHWQDVWDYFSCREYAALATLLRHEVERAASQSGAPADT